MLALLLHALILKRESEAFSSYQKADLSGWRVWARPGVVMNITHTPTQEESERKKEKESMAAGALISSGKCWWKGPMHQLTFISFFMWTSSLKRLPAEKSECLLVYVGGDKDTTIIWYLHTSLLLYFRLFLTSYFTHFICTGMTGCFNVSTRYTQKESQKFTENSSASCVYSPLYDESLIVFLSCKLLWIKVSAKWIIVNVNVKLFIFMFPHINIIEAKLKKENTINDSKKINK